MFKKIIFNKNGFTLLEMIVSIGIITVLISIFLSNYKGGNKRTELIIATQKAVTDIRLAQNNTLGSVKYNEQIPIGGWGIYINLSESNKNYLIFADMNGNLKYDIGAEDSIAYGSRTVSLPPNISFSKILTRKGMVESEVNDINLTFIPPDPETVIYNESSISTSSSVIITFKEDWNNSIKEVEINSFGLIEVLD